ncbi:MAG: hypothetical protein GY827_08030 [Cytophagales bacterium]|nr:hypothetical protein [Cytophagales bacterium]
MENLEDYKTRINQWIQSGFFSVQDMLWKLEGLGLDEQETKSFIQTSFTTFNEKAQTSNDVKQLIAVFDELASEGYITLHKAGYTASDAYDTIDEVLDCTSFKPFGYLLYNEQDVAHTIEYQELTLSFGAFVDSDQTQSSGMSKTEAGAFFKAKLEEKGLTVEWSGNPDKKITLTNFDFTKKYDQEEWSYERCIGSFENL